FTGMNLVVGAGNFYFQRVIGSAFTDQGEYGAANKTAVFVNLMGLPLLMASTAIIHHIAHFRGIGDEARLNGLLVGCRSLLLKFTLVACVLGALLIQPLGRYFEIPRTSLTVAALVSLIVALWAGYASALANGLGWFKRLALIGFAGVLAKIAVVILIARRHPVAEAGVLALAAGTLLNLAVFFWWRDLFKPGERVSPWDRDF